MLQNEMFLIGLLMNILSNLCFNIPKQNNETLFVSPKKDLIFCVIAKQLPVDDGPNKSPYNPRPMIEVYNSGATGTTGPTASETISPSSEV